jgi:hypothetical protein
MQSLRHFFGKLVPPIAIASILVIGPLLAFSETTLKSIMDRWLSQCIVVVEMAQKEAESPIVRLYSFGNMPESLPLTFATDKGLIERVSLLNHVEQGTAFSDPNLLVHPLANQRCPGDLCPDTGEPSEKLTIRLKPISTNYVYQLRVILRDQEVKNQLKVYVKPLLDEKMDCRVEKTTIANYFPRQTGGVQIFLLFLVVIVATLIINWLRSRVGRQS